MRRRSEYQGASAGSPGRSRPWTRLPILMGAVLLMLPAGASGATDLPDGAEYRLGRGLRLPALDLTLGGYTSLRARDLSNEEARLDLRDLSLFATWEPYPRWRGFTEVEVENAFSVDDDGLNAKDAEVVVERLYVDYFVNAALSLRGGRYLTPFGRWNLIHADPLVWTVTRPLVTSLAIPDKGIGGGAYGTDGWARGSLEYHVYFDASAEFDPVDDDTLIEGVDIPGLSNDFDHAAGLQLRYHFLDERAEVGASYASFEREGGDDWYHAFGLDALYRWRRAEFSMESAYRISGDPAERDAWGAFAQAAVPLIGSCYFVARAEYYRSSIVAREAGRGILGLAYRPHPAITFKIEYDDGSDPVLAPDGWQASWAILF